MMITTVNLNRDEHIETLDINVHGLEKNKQEEKKKKSSKIATYS